MQAAMDRLAAFLERRRLVVLVAWMAASAGRRSLRRSPERAPDLRRVRRPGLAVGHGRPQPRALRGRPERVPGGGAGQARGRRGARGAGGDRAGGPPRGRAAARGVDQRGRHDGATAGRRCLDHRHAAGRSTAARTSWPTPQWTSATSWATSHARACSPISSASRRCGPACRSWPRRTSRRRRPPAFPSSCSSCWRSSARWRRRRCRWCWAWPASASPGLSSTSSPRPWTCRCSSPTWPR